MGQPLSTFNYDDITGGNAGIGQLTSESLSGGGQPAFSRAFTYAGNEGGKLTQVSTTIGSDSFTTSQSYDLLGRMETLTYPVTPSYSAGLQVNYKYNARGYLEKVTNISDSTLLYQYTDVNQLGLIEGAWMGDGSTTANAFVANTARMESTIANRSAGTIQNFAYTYDALGNMLTRSDLLRNITETLSYDDFNRLETSTVTQGATTLDTVDYDYEDNGNISHKSDITSLLGSSMQYGAGAAGVHALTSLNTGTGTRSFTYDANGNLTSGSASGAVRNISWTSFDKPYQITQGALSRTFHYGPDRSRYQQLYNDGGSTTTFTYLGNYYTREDFVGSPVDHKMYIYANGKNVAIVVDDEGTSASSVETRFLHQDHLGSITSIVDSSGVENLAYDVFGRRRDATDWVGSVGPGLVSEERGFTGHEHLDDVNLIHMNGRIYDPVIARMASPDLFIQDPFNSQNFNRYSYVLNDPLGYTDPSGYFWTELIPLITCLMGPQYCAATILGSIISDIGSGGDGDGTYTADFYVQDYLPTYDANYIPSELLAMQGAYPDGGSETDYTYQSNNPRGLGGVTEAVAIGGAQEGERIIQLCCDDSATKKDSGGFFGGVIRFSHNTRKENKLIDELFFAEDSPLTMEFLLKKGNFKYGFDQSGDAYGKYSVSSGIYSVSGTIDKGGRLFDISVSVGGARKLSNVEMGLKVNLYQVFPYAARQFDEFIVSNSGLSGRAYRAIRDRQSVLDEHIENQN